MMGTQARRWNRPRAFAWVAFGLGFVIDALFFWTDSPASDSVYLAIFGPANEYEFFVLLAIYILAMAVDITVAIALKGWPNRVLAFAGLLLLLVPVAVGIWTGETA